MFLETTILLATVILFYHFWNLRYWKRKNVFYIPGEPIFGNIKDVLLKKMSFVAFIDELYKKHKEHRIIGFYALYKPMILITDTELIKDVMVSNFNSFSDNGFCLDVKVDPLFGINPFCTKGLRQIGGHIEKIFEITIVIPTSIASFSLGNQLKESREIHDKTKNSENEFLFFSDDVQDEAYFINRSDVDTLSNLRIWKDIRSIQVPMQTTLKLKEMIPQIIDVGKQMKDYLLKNCSEPLEVKEVTGMYTIDNVVSCAYGLKPSAFTDPENPFKKHATTTLFDGGFLNTISPFLFPKVGELLSLSVVKKEAEEFFVGMMKKIVSYRKRTKSNRNDLIDNLIKLDQKRIEDQQPTFTDLELAGHCFTFYADGYETSSSALSFLLLELSNAPEIQERLRNEIMSVGIDPTQFDFDTIQSITYLGMVLNETLRKHLLLPILSRICTQDTVLGGVKISKGTKIFIPAVSLHNDPEFYPEPENFNPERFSEYNKDSIVKFTYLPFGEGPRTCVGSKFAIIQIKLAVIFILLKFRISPTPGMTNGKIEYDDTSAFVLTPKIRTKLRFDPL